MEKAPLRWPLRLLLIAPLFVFWPIVFGGYTLSQSPVGLDTSRVYGGYSEVVPVADPSPSAGIDEPYLAFWKRSVLAGEWPVINMKNAMGHPSAESLLTGWFYLLNPILLLLPTSRPIYYDLFQLLHVYVLLLGLYALLRHYVPPVPAACIAIVVALSGVTYMIVNMINFRSLAWTAWIMAGAVGLARDVRVRYHAGMLAFAAVACGTAGNPQEFAADLSCAILIYVCEAMSGGRIRRHAVFVASLACALLVWMPAILPYGMSGDVWVPKGVFRSMAHYSPAWFLSCILPLVNGSPAFHFLHVEWSLFSDFSTSGFFFVLTGLYFAWRCRGEFAGSAAVRVCIILPCAIAAGFVLIAHPPFLDFIQHVPGARNFLFLKYHEYLFVLASVPAAIGLHALSELPAGERRKACAIPAAFVLLALAAIVPHLHGRADYAFPTGPISGHYVFVYAVSIATFAACVLLIGLQPRRWRGILAAVLLVQSACLLPIGWRSRVPQYADTFRGAVPGVDVAGKRLLLSLDANQNLFFDVEAFGLFDGVMNVHYRTLLDGFFQVTNWSNTYTVTNGRDGWPLLAAAMKPAQVRALQVAGVEGAYGYEIEAPDQAVRIGRKAWRIVEPLPRVFAVSDGTYRFLGTGRLLPDRVDAVYERIRADLPRLPQPRDILVEGRAIRFRLDRIESRSHLILNQAYSGYWRLNGHPGSPVIDLWPSWPAEEINAGEGVCSYWPTGLTVALWCVAVGLAGYLSLDRFVLRKCNSRATSAGGSPAL